ncbi:hypothetical protein MalM25_17420 [Planctomycetes bacterium MalM25]|nr:hypothetical protein MalM25_17420 [Planctomycetes bacterium MalM25]
MNLLGDFHFLRPAWLLLAPAMVWLWWFWRRSQDPLSGLRRAFDPRLLKAMTVGDPRVNNRREIGTLAAWVVGLIALAGPTWLPEPSPFAGDAAPVMLVLKAATTMDLTDLAPSRMERARLKAIDFAKRREGQPLGLMAYAGSAHLVLPPTRDTAVVATMAAEIGPEIMPEPGDALPEALRLAAKHLGDSGGTILVLADTLSGLPEEAFTPLGGNRPSIQVWGVAQEESAEADALRSAASDLNAGLVMLTPDEDDVDTLITRTSRPALSRPDADGGVRWTESGWWLVPLLTAWSLTSFRRVVNRPTLEVSR